MTNWPDFSVPPDWQVSTVGQFAQKMRAGGTPKRGKKEYWEGEIPFALIEDITATGIYLRSTQESISELGLQESSAWIVPPRSVLLTMYATIGATAVNTIPLATNQAILAIIPDNHVDPDFLALCLRAHKRELAMRNVEATQKNINKGIVESFPVPIPPLPEQRQIAAVLNLVRRAIEQQERLIALTTELKQALMHKLFTEGLHGEPQKMTDIGPIPESWKVEKVREIAKLKSGGTPSRKEKRFWLDGTISWVKTGEVDYCVITDTEEKITEEGLRNSSAKLFPKGTLLMAMYGQGVTRGKVGILGVEAATNQACVAFFPSDSINSKFLFYFFEFHYERVRQIGHGANQKNLSAELINGMEVAYPTSRQQQEQIVQMLQLVDRNLQLHRVKKETLGDLFRTLLHQLMTAQIRVTNLDLSDLGDISLPAAALQNP